MGGGGGRDAAVGPKGGFKPIKLLVNEGYSRAWKGGTGQFKLGACVPPRVRVRGSVSVWVRARRFTVSK